jgi:hypothetical protein
MPIFCKLALFIFRGAVKGNELACADSSAAAVGTALGPGLQRDGWKIHQLGDLEVRRRDARRVEQRAGGTVVLLAGENMDGVGVSCHHVGVDFEPQLHRQPAEEAALRLRQRPGGASADGRDRLSSCLVTQP